MGLDWIGLVEGKTKDTSGERRKRQPRLGKGTQDAIRKLGGYGSHVRGRLTAFFKFSNSFMLLWAENNQFSHQTAIKCP